MIRLPGTMTGCSSALTWTCEATGLAREKRLPACASRGGPSRTQEVGVPSSTISATSKLPSGSGLATTRMPGWVVPGPFGNFALVGVVVRDVGVVLGDGEPEGVGAVEFEAVDRGVALAIAGADRGSSGASL